MMTCGKPLACEKIWRSLCVIVVALKFYKVVTAYFDAFESDAVRTAANDSLSSASKSESHVPLKYGDVRP